MNYILINKALLDISELRTGRLFKRVLQDKREEGECEGSYTEFTEIYCLEENELYLKLILRTDSYGDNTAVESIQIVKPVIKTITDFETIK
jgi:hypothetical protein